MKKRCCCERFPVWLNDFSGVYMMAIGHLISESLVFFCALWLAWRGYERGVIRTLQRFVAILCAYVGCYFLTAPLAEFLQPLMGLPLIPSYLVSAVIAFVVITVLVEKSITVLADHVENRGIEPAKIPGAILGGLLGSVLGLLLAWTVGILLDSYLFQQHPRMKPPAPDPVRTTAGNIIGNVVEQGLAESLGDESLVPALTSKLLANPVGLTQQVMHVSQSDAMRALFADPYAQQLMLSQQTEALKNHVHFQTLMALPEAREIFLLLSDQAVAGEGTDAQDRVAHLLSDMYQKVSRLQHDPRFLNLAQKPEFKQLAQNPSPVAMLANPALSELAEIIFDPAPASSLPATLIQLEPLQWEVPEEAFSEEEEQALDPDRETAAPEGLVMYRWTDANGRKHYSETRPTEDYEVEVVRLSP
jgi:uncharacterized membrane protein required for colicin V production